jgi:hypothetical protein
LFCYNNQLKWLPPLPSTLEDYDYSKNGQWWLWETSIKIKYVLTEREKQLRRNVIAELNAHLNHLKCLPMDEILTVSFVGEEYRKTKKSFYEQVFLLSNNSPIFV